MKERHRKPLLGAVEHFLGNVDRKSTRLNSSHSQISYAVFCLKKKTYKNRYWSSCQTTFPNCAICPAEVKHSPPSKNSMTRTLPNRIATFSLQKTDTIRTQPPY